MLESVIHITLLPSNSLMIRPPSSSSAWQTATLRWLSGPPPAATPSLFVSSTDEFGLVFWVFLFVFFHSSATWEKSGDV